MKSNQRNLLFRLIQLATVAVFFGRAYQHLFWDAPYRSVLWDEVWMSGIVESLSSMSWEEFITSSVIDERIQSSIRLTGWFYLIAGFVALFIKKVPRVLTYLLLIGSFLLVLLAALYCKEKFYSLGQFFEYSLQFLSPIFLFLLSKPSAIISDKMIWWMKVATALTFTCHGLYAVNFYPLPGLFVEMTINILGVGEQTARQFLLGAGIMDFITSVLIFFPYRVSKYALLYMFLWGLATALARIWAHFYIDYPWECLHQWWQETFYRFCHFLIPLVIFLYYRYHEVSNE